MEGLIDLSKENQRAYQSAYRRIAEEEVIGDENKIESEIDPEFLKIRNELQEEINKENKNKNKSEGNINERSNQNFVDVKELENGESIDMKGIDEIQNNSDSNPEVYNPVSFSEFQKRVMESNRRQSFLSILAKLGICIVAVIGASYGTIKLINGVRNVNHNLAGHYGVKALKNNVIPQEEKGINKISPIEPIAQRKIELQEPKKEIIEKVIIFHIKDPKYRGKIYRYHAHGHIVEQERGIDYTHNYVHGINYIH